MAGASVPVFKLYGETHHWPTPDLLHCESIPERSQLHDWHIHPHRHTDLVHLLYVSAGRLTLEMEGESREQVAPLLIVVPAMSIHGFHFSPDTDGAILTLAQPMVEQLESRLGSVARVLLRRGAYPAGGTVQGGRIAALFRQLREEYLQPAQGRELILESLASALTVEACRLMETQAPRGSVHSGPSDRAEEHIHNYQALIEGQFRQQPSVEAFAGQLGLTGAHLNLLCRRLVGRSALELLHERLLLEAKRQLTYTNMGIGQVAESLGFSEPAYFTRFFKRLTGDAPRDFRQRQRSLPA